MIYTDYTYYTTTFLGTLIPASDFDKLAMRASLKIDVMTYQRAASQTDLDILDRLAMATCAVAEELYTIEVSGAAEVQSESVGGVSVTYTANSKNSKPVDSRCRDVAYDYLISTGLLFMGFKTDEYGVDLSC